MRGANSLDEELHGFEQLLLFVGIEVVVLLPTTGPAGNSNVPVGLLDSVDEVPVGVLRNDSQ